MKNIYVKHIFFIYHSISWWLGNIRAFETVSCCFMLLEKWCALQNSELTNIISYNDVDKLMPCPCFAQLTAYLSAMHNCNWDIYHSFVSSSMSINTHAHTYIQLGESHLIVITTYLFLPSALIGQSYMACIKHVTLKHGNVNFRWDFGKSLCLEYIVHQHFPWRCCSYRKLMRD